MMRRLWSCVPKARFLFCMSAIYLFAFASLYIQLPGLYSETGVTPVHLSQLSVPRDFEDFLRKPCILRFHSLINVDVYVFMEFLVVFGCVLSFLAFSLEYFRGKLVFMILWVIYLSLFQVGQVFLWFQWDLLLLEVGVLTILLAPCSWFLDIPRNVASDGVALWLIRWLLFRLMFSSGVVKLTSKCPTWWGLSALNWHYQSQCLPLPSAWYAHALPSWVQELSVSIALAIEIVLPVLFFIPLRAVRLFSFYSQVILQLAIIATGNYNFFNMLTITLCYSLLTDDEFLPARKRSRAAKSWLTTLVSFAVIGFALYTCVTLFGITIKGNTISTKIAFTEYQFLDVLSTVVVYATYVPLVLYAFEVFVSVLTALQAPGCLRKLFELFLVAVISIIGVCLLLASFIPLANLVPASASSQGPLAHIPSPAVALHQRAHQLHLVSSYGLFRRMTGVDGRPELVVQASSSSKAGPWKEVHFWHKPGSLDAMPTVVIPHQPRLDWQMWFAALGSIEHNPWFTNFVYRLLQNEKSVTGLLKSTPFPTAPKFIRAQLYTYQFTKSLNDQNWWTRTLKREYLPAVSLDDESLKKAVTDSGLIGRRRHRPMDENMLTASLSSLRQQIGQPKDLSALLLVCLIIFITNVAYSRSCNFNADY